jgi:endonuclease I
MFHVFRRKIATKAHNILTYLIYKISFYAGSRMALAKIRMVLTFKCNSFRKQQNALKIKLIEIFLPG